jgi:hypothetical protein
MSDDIVKLRISDRTLPPSFIECAYDKKAVNKPLKEFIRGLRVFCGAK